MTTEEHEKWIRETELIEAQEREVGRPCLIDRGFLFDAEVYIEFCGEKFEPAGLTTSTT